MGMFDELRCRYPLPVDGASALLFQTKDTPIQCMDQYEIREDGTLWHEDHDIEDHSDPKAEGIMRMCGMLTRVNKRWEQLVNFTGEIRFYTTRGKHNSGWIEFSAYFKDGRVHEVNLIEDRPPTNESESKRSMQISEALAGMED